MEAVWTRYFPLSIYVRDTITSGRLGTVHRASADYSMSMSPEESFADGKHRMVNMDLAGGAMLDIGIYAITWIFQSLYHTQPESARQAPSVLAAIKKYPATGADEMTTILLTFPRSKELGGDAHGIATTSIRVSEDPDNKTTAGPAIRIQGEKGEMQVYPPASRPTRTKLILSDGTVEDKTWEHPAQEGFVNGFGGDMNKAGEAHGMYWEADECGYALKEGRKEGKYEGLDESVVIMEVMDEVRRQGGLKYPEQIETLEYPVKF